MSDKPAPVVLELAPLPREQLGPFFILGVDKEAGREEIEAAWAARVIAARKGSLKVPLEDVNWARESVNDPDKRVRAELTSLNADTAEELLRRLAERYGVTGNGTPLWRPWDDEKPLADYTPATEVPRPEEVRPTVPAPEVPFELPAVGWLLDKLAKEELDPWALNFSSDSTKDTAS